MTLSPEWYYVHCESRDGFIKRRELEYLEHRRYLENLRLAESMAIVNKAKKQKQTQNKTLLLLGD